MARRRTSGAVFGSVQRGIGWVAADRSNRSSGNDFDGCMPAWDSYLSAVASLGHGKYRGLRLVMFVNLIIMLVNPSARDSHMRSINASYMLTEIHTATDESQERFYRKLVFVRRGRSRSWSRAAKN